MSDNVHEHPELKAEQAHVDHAHACLDAARERALHLTRMVEVGQGGVALLVSNGLLIGHETRDRKAVGAACLAALEQWSEGRGARSVGR